MLLRKSAIKFAMPGNDGIGTANPKYQPLIANLMAPIFVPTVEKSSPWHPFTRLLHK